MVFFVVASDYVGFPNTRMAMIPEEDGQTGELRVTHIGLVQFRVYKPLDHFQETSHLCLPITIVDDFGTQVSGCEARIITLNNYEFWFRFITDACAVVFARLLDSYDNLGAGVDFRQMYMRRRLNRPSYFSTLLEPGLWESNENWKHPWTIDEVDHSKEIECQCNRDGHVKYSKDYSWDVICHLMTYD